MLYIIVFTFVIICVIILFFFFFNDTATTEIYTLSLHDALPILLDADLGQAVVHGPLQPVRSLRHLRLDEDRKSTRLNSSHANISYAVFCLKKKKKKEIKKNKNKKRSVPLFCDNTTQ